MQFPIVQQFKIDLLGTNPENAINNEPIEVPDNTKGGTIIIPRHSPFFVDSLELSYENGQPMVFGEDYILYKIMGKLTETCGQPVGALIRIITPGVESVLASYQTVGEFSLIDNGVLQILSGASNDDRPVEWDSILNKPTSFPPKLHTHSLLYEMMAFQDTVDLIKSIVTAVKESPEKITIEVMRQKSKLIQHYVAQYTESIRTYLSIHVDSYNPHALTKAQIDLGNVDNFPAALPTEVLELRDDRFLTPKGLEVLIRELGFTETEYLPNDLLPFSRYGGDHTTSVESEGSFQATGPVNKKMVVTFSDNADVIFKGRGYKLPAVSIDLRDVDPDPFDKTFYAYALFNFGTPIYSITTEELPASVYLLWIGEIKTDAAQITSLKRFTPFTIEGRSHSETKRGSSLPSSSGSINTTGDLPWIKPSELIT